ncbi:unnamed protein product, partial [Pocillopora meandrina]
DLIAYYPLNEEFKAREIDDKQPAGVLGQVELTTGPHGETNGSYQFSGNPNSFIEFPNDGGLDTLHSITLMCWVQPGGRDGPLFNYKNSGAWGVHIWIVNGKFFNRITKYPNHAFFDAILTDQALPVGQWAHVAATYDHITGVNSLYVNGHLSKTKYIGKTDRISTNDGQVRMGVKIGDSRYFNGKIAQMKVFDVALDEADIQAAMNEGHLIAYYPLNEEFKAREFDNKQPAGVLGQVELTTGPHGETNGSYQFSGNPNSFIEFPNDGGLDTLHSITLMCWVQPGGRDGPLFNYKNSGAWGVHIWIVNGKFFNRITKYPNHAFFDAILTDQVLPVGQWAHVAATYDHITGVNSLYVNGHLSKTKYIGKTDRISTNDGQVRMGVKIGDSRHFNGKIAQMKVYDVALNEVDIKAAMNEGNAQFKKYVF